jgi:lysozyme
MRKSVIAATAAAALALALPVIQKWEGRSLVAYRDVAGVWTICDGETEGVKRGDTATPVQCDRQTEGRVAEFEAKVRPCLPADLPVQTRAAFVVAAL